VPYRNPYEDGGMANGFRVTAGDKV